MTPKEIYGLAGAAGFLIQSDLQLLEIDSSGIRIECEALDPNRNPCNHISFGNMDSSLLHIRSKDGQEEEKVWNYELQRESGVLSMRIIKEE